jgi:adenosylcobinamide-phosphate synthase
MTLFSFIFAMLLEQVRPIRDESRLGSSVGNALLKAERATSSGEKLSAFWTWIAVVIGGTVLVWLLVSVLGRIHFLLGFIATVAVLYLTIGFRQFSNRFTEIQLALASNDLDRARTELAKWRAHSGGDDMTRIASESGDVSAICREAIRLALVGAQRHVFGVIFWFVILPGPAGAVLYRLSAEARRVWADTRDMPADPSAVKDSSALAAANPFGEFAVRAFAWVDWVPARVTAIVFSVVGNFEDAILLWRKRSGFWPHANDTERVVLSAGEGAMGVRLSLPEGHATSVHVDDGSEETEALGGAWPSMSQEVAELREADENALRSAVGLVWRSVIVWITIMLLVSVGYWLG